MDELFIAALSPAGLTEMRTFHGGLMLSLGIFFLYAAAYKAYCRAGLLLMAVTYAGAVVARALGIYMDNVESSFIWNILIAESSGLLAATVCLLLLQRMSRGTISGS